MPVSKTHQKHKIFYDPYTEALRVLNRKGVRYVVVGMSGINYYASKAQEIFSTQDFDIFVKPTIENVARAVSVIEKLGYDVVTNEGSLKGFPIKAVVRERKTIVASNPFGIMIELILSVSGFTFNQMSTDATIFHIGNIPVKVAKLKKLLLSKRIAGREKDRFFLRRYEILLKERAAFRSKQE